MKEKSVKQAELESIKADLAEHATLVVCSFQGLKVEQDFELRKRVRAAGGSYRVAPNRIMQLAAKETPYEGALSGLKGMTSLAFGDEDPIALLKTMVDYGKEFPVFSFRAGVVEGRVLDVDALNALAQLPGRDGVYAKLLYLLNAPAQQVMGILNAPGRTLAATIQVGVDEQKFSA